ncbi:MAG: hypothetical protein IIY21_02130 [Clostridiales bacterium]|nr:hypothetical protein [Clostridiales bacterium]
MATYTDNYTMTKPTYAEQADISVINANMDIIDNVMHSSQISLAPAYDLNETYNTGDVVMYELLMYKCLADNVTGAWDSTKWTCTTAGEESGGGADLDIYGEASGTAEASFSDGAEASLVECEIGIVPSQDLHGYSKPWAGGAGKNKLNNTATSQTVNLVDYTVNPDGTVKAEGTATGGYALLTLGSITLENGNEYILSGCPQGGSGSTYSLFISGSGTFTQKVDYGNTIRFTMNETVTTPVSVIVYNGATVDINFEPMIRLASAPSGYEPYSNICPISGHSSVTVTVASTSGGSGEDYTVNLGSTYYGGNLDVTTGELEVTWENIASYAGETLTGEWLSSLDEYSTLGTPTTGAQVVYELATPQTFNLTPTQVKTLLGQNYVSHDGGGTISLVYIKKDSTIIPNPSDAEVPLTGLEISGKGFKITDARIPAPPTNNGAYVLTVTVSGGTPTYSWENA